MMVKGITKVISVLIVFNIFMLQNCALVLKGTRQKIPVSSVPSGAKVTVDGKDKGTTPLILKLERNKKLQLVGIEKPGYERGWVHVKRKKPEMGERFQYAMGYSLCGVAIAAFIEQQNIKSIEGKDADASYGKAFLNVISGNLIFALTIGYILRVPDLVSGLNYNLSPKKIVMTLKKIERE